MDANVRSWPGTADLGVAASLRLSGYTGRGANAVKKAARDPMQNSRLLFSRDGSQFTAKYPDGLKVFDVVRSH